MSRNGVDFHAKPIGEPGRSLYIITRGHGKYSFSIFRVQHGALDDGPHSLLSGPSSCCRWIVNSVLVWVGAIPFVCSHVWWLTVGENWVISDAGKSFCTILKFPFRMSTCTILCHASYLYQCGGGKSHSLWLQKLLLPLIISCWFLTKL